MVAYHDVDASVHVPHEEEEICEGCERALTHALSSFLESLPFQPASLGCQHPRGYDGHPGRWRVGGNMWYVPTAASSHPRLLAEVMLCTGRLHHIYDTARQKLPRARDVCTWEAPPPCMVCAEHPNCGQTGDSWLPDGESVERGPGDARGTDSPSYTPHTAAPTSIHTYTSSALLQSSQREKGLFVFVAVVV